MKQSQSKKELFEELTWSSIRDWSGATIADRGKNYHKRGSVHELALTPGGGLIAWVSGTRRYATLVDFEDEELISSCTCPYEGTCKHAVAVVLEYLNQLKKGADMRSVTRQDPRLNLLDMDIQEKDFEHENTPGRNHDDKDIVGELHSFLTQKNQNQLISLIENLAKRHPSVLRDVQAQYSLSMGNVGKIVKTVRKEIYEISSEPAWTNHWNNEGYTPDYSHVKETLEMLLAHGHADEVLNIGQELLERGTDQIETSDDEGETADEISSCLDVVFLAVKSSSLSPANQILWVIDAELKDRFDICQGAERFWEEEEYTREDWKIVAIELEKRMKTITSVKNGNRYDIHSYNYRRNKMCDWLIQALERAGHSKDIIPLCEKEAEETGSYIRLVRYLKDAKRWQEAEQWIRKGINATQQQWPGIADQLRGELRDIKEREGNLIYVTALRFNDFIRYPSLNTFQEVTKVAHKATVAFHVRTATLNFLETGVPPQKDPAWPLPDTGLPENVERHQKHFPMTHVLIDIAIAEKRPDDVIRWYDHVSSIPGYSKPLRYRSDAVAAAIANNYPDRAVAIWKECAEGQISLTQPKAYQVASVHLRNIRKILMSKGMEKEWRDYLAGLRQANYRKKRLLEILDELE